MGKVAKVFLITLGIFIAALMTFFVYALIVTKDTKLDVNKLFPSGSVVQIYDKNDNIVADFSDTHTQVSISEVNDYTKNAFIAIEDKRFYSHNGIDVKGVFRAGIRNVTTFSFGEGASTITQQLIKNTHLSSEKTFDRKLKELKLAIELEKKYSKEQILEMYLNQIYFGDNCYGIADASAYYFDKKVNELNKNESAMLAGIIKAPTYYSPKNNYEKANERKNTVLLKMYEQKYITEEEFQSLKQVPVTLKESERQENLFIKAVKTQLKELRKNDPYKAKYCKIYTSYDMNLQIEAQSKLDALSLNCKKLAVIMNDNAQICAMAGNTLPEYRSPASTIKPIAVYAPAVEENCISELSIINDEKTDFNGYSPSNYNDVYYGNISVKTAVAKSSNIVAAKVLNYIGVEKASEYLGKVGIKVDDKDKNLALALGGMTNGTTLDSLVSAYLTFANSGFYIEPTLINKITDKEGTVLYYKNKTKNHVFSSATAEIINDMLKNTAENGTASKIKIENIPICAKTGTNGVSQGNYDAYTISYTKDYAMGVWLGNADNKLLENNVTGGTYPAVISKNIWQAIYNNKTPSEFTNSGKVKELRLDKISYEKDYKLVIADEIAPEKYVIKGKFKADNIPYEKSDRFSCPKICSDYKTSVNFGKIEIELCQTEPFGIIINRGENGKIKQLYDSVCKENSIFCDTDVENGHIYEYTIIPYYYDGKEKHFGESFTLPKVKYENSFDGEFKWWNDSL